MSASVNHYRFNKALILLLPFTSYLSPHNFSVLVVGNICQHFICPYLRELSDTRIRDQLVQFLFPMFPAFRALPIPEKPAVR